MSDETRVVHSDPEILSGTPVFVGTRVPVQSLFDYIEGAEGFDKFIFPSPYGEGVTKSVLDIDEPLAATFAAKVRELGHLQPVERLARIA